MSRVVRSVLVTGGQGFVGRHLVHRWLSADGDVRVVAIGRSPALDDTFTHTVSWSGSRVMAPLPPALRSTDPSRYAYRCVDLLDTAALSDLLVDDAVDTVVHLAASLRDEPLDRLVRNNVLGTQSLLEAATGVARDGLRVVIGSSGSVYGSLATADLPTHEGVTAAPIDLYSVTKRTAEDLASVQRRRSGLDVVVARIFNVIGPGQDERHLAPSLARQFAERMAGVVTGPVQVGPLDTSRDFVDVQDVAGALMAIASADPDPTVDLVNVASGVETPTRQVFDRLARRAGQPESVGPALPPRRLDFQRQWADVSRLASLGFEPGRSLADTLDGMLRYYLDHVGASTGANAP